VTALLVVADYFNGGRELEDARWQERQQQQQQQQQQHRKQQHAREERHVIGEQAPGGGVCEHVRAGVALQCPWLFFLVLA